MAIYECAGCSIFRNRLSLQTHIRTVHRVHVNFTKTNKYPPNFCIDCKLQFINKNDLFKHLHMVHGIETSYETGICRKRIFNSGVYVHMAEERKPRRSRYVLLDK